MTTNKTRLTKVLVGQVISDKMTRTVVVEVTTFKRHPLYQKRYRWTEKYLADTGTHEPQVGDTVRLIASRPLSRRKRWVVDAVVSQAGQVEQQAVKRQTGKSEAKPKSATKSAGRKGK